MDAASAAVFVTVQKFYYPLLCILGIPANLLTFYLLCRRRCSMSAVTAVYLGSLALADALYLLWVNLVDLTLTFWLPRPFWHAHPWCPLLAFLQHGALYSSSWLVLAFTVQRYLALCGTWAPPQRGRRLARVRMAKVACGAVVLASHAASVPVAWINEVGGASEGAEPRCRYREQAYATAIVWVTGVLSLGAPMALVLLFNALIGRRLCRARRLFTAEQRRRLAAGGAGPRRGALLLLGAVSAAFVALGLPRFVTYCVLRTAHNRATFDRDDYGLPLNVAADAANMLHNLNSAANFLLYCLVSRRFRRQLRHLLACRGSAPSRPGAEVSTVARPAAAPAPPSDPVAVVLSGLKDPAGP